MPLRNPLARRVSSEEPVRILSIGGGTGLSTLLQGLKYYANPTLSGHEASPVREPLNRPLELTAVVTVTDDGGSSGRLRRDFDVLPPGDIRNCMVALSEDAALLSKLFQYRFSAGRGLKGHSFGNLFLTVLTQITGDFAHAVKLSSEVLASAGRIFPSTAANVILQAKLEDGSVVTGETQISKAKSRIQSIVLKPRRVHPLSETLEAIEQADLITFGPGSLFTSVIPNLLVSGIPEAISKSNAIKAYFCNLMWQPTETMHFSAVDHVAAIHKHARCNLLDCVVVNSKAVSAPHRRRYAAQQAQPVKVDIEALQGMGLRVVEAELLAQSEKVRHDSHRAAAVAVRLALMGRRRRQRAQSFPSVAAV
ncbi:MAG: uridine diphosphate-N-acetylglucosamine-binding protein YvcK [Bryobacterales bacterium]|nr:uridine diphosphate-N-acetylglucosamine-binding protein YvcK [Bryobacterales bacterium]